MARGIWDIVISLNICAVNEWMDRTDVPGWGNWITAGMKKGKYVYRK